MINHIGKNAAKIEKLINDLEDSTSKSSNMELAPISCILIEFPLVAISAYPIFETLNNFMPDKYAEMLGGGIIGTAMLASTLYFHVRYKPLIVEEKQKIKSINERLLGLGYIVRTGE